MDPNQNYFQGLPHSDTSAFPYLNQAMGQVHQYYDPYTQFANNPQDFINQIYASFQDSPIFQRERDERMKGLTSAAAASGRINNPAYEREFAELGGNLMSEQMRRYLQDVMGERQLGLQAAQGASGDISNIFGTGATLAQQQDLQKESDRRGLIDAIMQGATSIGGSILGGPIGSVLGQGLSKWMGF